PSQHLLVPAARFLRSEFETFASLTPIAGWRSAESRTGACEAPVGPARNAAGQAPSEAPCVPYGGRPPPGAPPWRFWAPVPRFPHQNCFRLGQSERIASWSCCPAGGVPALAAP